MDAQGVLQMFDQGRQRQAQQRAQSQQGLMQLMQVQKAMEEQKLSPLKRQLLEAQIKKAIADADTEPERRQLEALVKSLQAENELGKIQERQVQGRAREGLAGLMRGDPAQWGGSNLTGVMTDENAAREAAIAADRAGQPVNIGVPNPATIQSLSVQANPQTAIPELLRQQRPQKPQTPSGVGRLIAERDALPPNDPMRRVYDNAIEKQTTHQPPVNIYSGSLASGVDEKGNPIFVQPSGREGVPPRPVTGIYPPEKSNVTKAREQDREAQATVQSVRDRVVRLSALVQKNPTAVGAAGLVRRGAETIGGVAESLGGPQIPTPAIDFQNEQALLLADVRKMVEKDPNLSKDERERLYQTLGGGISQTPSSAIRAMNNVLEYVERKKLTGPSRGATPKPTTQSEFNALPSGAVYIDPDDGKQYRKP